MLTGTQLIADINGFKPKAGECGIWWLGQHSFVVKCGGAVLYLDPFLSPYEGRVAAPMLRPEEVTNATLVFGSHDHADHVDRAAWPGIAAASPAARFVVPELLRERLAAELQIPAGRFAGVDDGQTVTLGAVEITGVAAAHEFLDQDQATGRYPYMGFAVRAGGFTLYHPGDCCIYEGLHAKLRRWKFDVAFLPINGRDAARFAAGCIGNMTYQEAADLAGAITPGITIPAHYDMFAMNSADPQLFVDYMRVKYPHLNVHVCDYGARLVVSHP